MEVFDNDLDRYYDSFTETDECRECGAPVDVNQLYCSGLCFEASMR